MNLIFSITNIYCQLCASTVLNTDMRDSKVKQCLCSHGCYRVVNEPDRKQLGNSNRKKETISKGGSRAEMSTSIHL